jgi:hypothetical protein
MQTKERILTTSVLIVYKICIQKPFNFYYKDSNVFRTNLIERELTKIIVLTASNNGAYSM